MEIIIILFLLFTVSIVFFVLDMVKVAKKQKSKAFGVASLILSFILPIMEISTAVSIFYYEIYMPLFVIILVFSIVSIVLSCFILPSDKTILQNATQNTVEENETKNLDTSTNNSVVSEVEEDTNKEEVNEVESLSDEEFKEVYKHSARRKIEIAGLICGIISAVMLVVCLGCSFSGLANIMIPFYIICFICGGVWIWSIFAKRRFCCRCGCLGEEISCEQTGQSTKVERKLITQNHERQSANGHITIDKNGNEYIEQLVTTTTYEITMMCPNCKNTWTFSKSKKS